MNSSKIALIKNDGTQQCVALQTVLDQCPNFDCSGQSEVGTSLNLAQVYQITSDCFANLNRKIAQTQKTLNQSGGGCNRMLSQQGDGIKVNIDDLKKNLHQYLVLHNITQLTDATSLPFGIIISTLNLPNDFEILSELCPYLKEYLAESYPNGTAFDSNGQINKGVLIPIGVMLDVEDIEDINRLY